MPLLDVVGSPTFLTQQPGGSFTEITNASEFDKGMVAACTRAQIDAMDSPTLVRLIRAAQMPFLDPEVDRHLPMRDRATLRRLAYIARRCCRNQGY